MSDQGATAFPSQTMVDCGVCGEKFDVNWFCKNCAGSICDKCYHIHRKTEISRRHIVVPRTVEVLRLHGPAKIAEICQYHPTKEVSAYCNECKVPCCLLCLSNNHQRHVFSPIEDVYLSAEKNLDKYVRELQKDVKPTLDEMMESFRDQIERNEVQIEKVKAEINIFKQTLIQRVVESCDLLLKEIDQVKDDGRNFVNELRASKDKLDQLMKDIETIIGVGKLDIIEYSPPDPKSFIQNPPLNNLRVPRFVPRNDLIDLIEKKIEIGKIEFDKEITKMQKKSSTRPKDILK
ncbi:hypothetical protein FSP39_012003 [Pinctada imbricata]|uniref:B box-type domain-containing protein n=1 Tax=Pinctada imbricata TaxID=66713 RepID=A0AA89BUQ8_PINIB|nr:hypothetical protein FSP39_012003 [Pinctada imbricata]